MPRPDRIGVVVNPERIDLVDELVARLTDAGCDVTTARPDDAGGLGESVDELLAADVDAVAAVGGDGTQRLVAARLADTDTPLAVVPGGTVNLLARVLGTGDLDLAVAAIVGGETRTIDIGALDDHVFVLNASTGWDAALIHAVDESAKRFGRLGYTASGVRQWFRSTTDRVTVRLDGDEWFAGEAMTVVVLNVGQRGSESMHLAPDARLDDGRLDVVVLRRKSVVDLARAAMAGLRGSPPPPDVASVGQAATVEVEWSEPSPVQRDGDDCGVATTTTYTCRPGALRIVVPTP